MTTRMVLSLGASALLLGGTMVGCAGSGGGIASASDRNAATASRAAARDAAKANKALGKHDARGAIGQAEAAVALMPRNADYRVLLGQSYLQGGRFASARAAFADALALAPDNGKAALNFALAQIATGDWSGARKTLDDRAATLTPADRGLALALAGDPAGGVAVLADLARSSNSTPTVRQNLALSYALAGEWRMARMVASVDMSPAEVDARMEQWAAFARPASASDQVAALLDVRPVEDAGQPIALALNAAVPATPGNDAPIDTAELSPDAAVPPQAAPAVERVHGPVLAEQEVPPPAAAPVNLLPPRFRAAKVAAAVRTPRPARVAMTIRAAAGPAKIAIKPQPVRAPVPAKVALVKGSWFVQLGAFDSPGVARDAWGRAARRLPALAGRGPSGAFVTTKAGQFYRLSVGGFARGDAVQLCQRYRTTGGQCFVRAGAGDQVAQWLRKSGVQLASR